MGRGGPITGAQPRCAAVAIQSSFVRRVRRHPAHAFAIGPIELLPEIEIEIELELFGREAATHGHDREILVKGVREAIGVTPDLERGHVYYTSGASGRVGRANLDGGDAHDLVTGSGALTRIALAQLPSH